MAANYEINDLKEYWPNPETACWMVEATRASDGQKYRHIFPKTTLAYRAAEYGIDPADTETLIDIILHEPFAASPDDPVTAPNDPALAAGLTAVAVVARGTVKVGQQTNVTLFNADSIAQAREAHLLRIRHAKTATVLTLPQGRPDPLAKLKAAPVDRELVVRHADAVATRRSLYRGEEPDLPPSTLFDDTHPEARRA